MTIELLERPAEDLAPRAVMIPIAQQIWDGKYRFAPAGIAEACIEKSWMRVAQAAASAEKTPALRKRWERHFYDVQAGFKFLPGGRILAGAEELKAVFDPRGGSWIGGAYVPSVPALIGLTLEEHFRRIGYLPPLSAEAEAV